MSLGYGHHDNNSSILSAAGLSFGRTLTLDLLRSTQSQPTLSQFINLGFSTLKLLNHSSVAFFSIAKLPISDAGACELAHVVIRELQRLGPTTRSVGIEIGVVDRSYYPKYSGKVSEDAAYYPVWMIDQALPIGVAYKFIVNDAEFYRQVDKSCPKTLVRSLDEAVQQFNQGWAVAGCSGTEPAYLPPWQEQLSLILSAIEVRRIEALKLAINESE